MNSFLVYSPFTHTEIGEVAMEDCQKAGSTLVRVINALSILYIWSLWKFCVWGSVVRGEKETLKKQYKKKEKK